MPLRKNAMEGKAENTPYFWKPNPTANPLAAIEMRLAASPFIKEKQDEQLVDWAQKTIANDSLVFGQKSAAMAFLHRCQENVFQFPQEILTSLLFELSPTSKLELKTLYLYFFMLNPIQKMQVFKHTITVDMVLSNKLLALLYPTKLSEVLQLLTTKLDEHQYNYNYRRIANTIKTLLTKLNAEEFNHAWHSVLHCPVKNSTFFALLELFLTRLRQPQLEQLIAELLQKKPLPTELLQSLVPKLSSQQIVALFTYYYQNPALYEFEWGTPEYSATLLLQQNVKTLAANMSSVPDDIFATIFTDCIDQHDAIQIEILLMWQAAMNKTQAQQTIALFMNYRQVNQPLLMRFFSQHLGFMREEQINSLLARAVEMVTNNPSHYHDRACAYEFIMAAERARHTPLHFNLSECSEEIWFDCARVAVGVPNLPQEEKQRFSDLFRERWGKETEISPTQFALLLDSHTAVFHVVSFALSPQQRWQALQALITLQKDAAIIDLFINELDQTDLAKLLDLLLLQISIESFEFNIFKRLIKRLPQTILFNVFKLVFQSNNFNALGPIVTELDMLQIEQIVNSLLNKELYAISIDGITLRLLSSRLSSDQACQLLHLYADKDCQWLPALAIRVTTLNDELYNTILQKLNYTNPILIKTLLMWQSVLSEQQKRGLLQLFSRSLHTLNTENNLQLSHNNFNLIFKFFMQNISLMEQDEIKDMLHFAVDNIKRNEKYGYDLGFMHEFIVNLAYTTYYRSDDLLQALKKLEQCTRNGTRLMVHFLSHEPLLQLKMQREMINPSI